MSSQVVGTLYEQSKVCATAHKIEPPRTEAAARKMAGFHEIRRAERPYGARFQPAARSSTRQNAANRRFTSFATRGIACISFLPPRVERLRKKFRKRRVSPATKPPGRFTEAG